MTIDASSRKGNDPAHQRHEPDWSFPVARSQPCDPPAEYLPDADAPMRQVRLSYGGLAWLVTDYRTARTVLADHLSFSSDSTLPGYPPFPLSSKRAIPGHFLSMDPPQHTRLRHMVSTEFTGSRVRKRRPALTAIVADLVDRVAESAGPIDLVEAVSVPLSARVASDTLGTPIGDRDFFLTCTRDMQRHDATVAERTLAAGQLNRYLERLFTAKRRGNGADLFSRLARELDAEGSFSMAELVGVANLIVVAGLETTAGLVTLTMLSLLGDPAQGDLLRSDPQRWAAPAVNEALRYWTLVQHGAARVATRDIEMAGQLIRRGEGLIVHLATANRDPTVFDQPHRFDITRDARHQLAFGHGIHRCLGSVIAKAQTELAITELMTRLPTLRLADPQAAPTFLADMLVYGLRTLNLTW